MNSEFGDIKNYNDIFKSMNEFKPEIVFHMAAQPLVRYSYENPLETYNTNVLGTANLLEASRHIDSIKVIINVTTDKCYKNKEWVWGYREDEEMGGFDPYSNSKACSELVTSAFRNSYFQASKVCLASARAGNVIGGGDWADDRLIPDIFRSLKDHKKLKIRNPYATRPWQHVLEPLSGYFKLAQSLYEEGQGFAEAWNFGPNEDDCKSVKDIINYITPKLKSRLDYSLNEDQKLNKLHEAQFLRLDISKAKNYLSWHPTWTIDTALDMIVDWHEALDNNLNMRIFSIDQINLFEAQSKEKHNEKR
jgi:CDP-glucose 4,6-dehydratase